MEQDPFTKSFNQEKLPELEFVYIDPRVEGEDKYVYKCKATSPAEADLMFKQDIGFDPTTDPNIELVQVETEN